MKSRKNLLEQLKSLPHFGKNTVYQLGKQLGLKDGTIDTYISRFLKYKEVTWLNKGLYVSTDFFEKNKNDISYSFYLANVIRTPSYVSSWAALQYYNLATEAVHSITSVSLKATRDFETKAGNFSYQSIKKDLFSNFSLTKGKFDFYIASPSKALFDLLYFIFPLLRASLIFISPRPQKHCSTCSTSGRASFVVLNPPSPRLRRAGWKISRR